MKELKDIHTEIANSTDSRERKTLAYQKIYQSSKQNDFVEYSNDPARANIHRMLKIHKKQQEELKRLSNIESDLTKMGLTSESLLAAKHELERKHLSCEEDSLLKSEREKEFNNTILYFKEKFPLLGNFWDTLDIKDIPALHRYGESKKQQDKQEELGKYHKATQQEELKKLSNIESDLTKMGLTSESLLANKHELERKHLSCEEDSLLKSEREKEFNNTILYFKEKFPLLGNFWDTLDIKDIPAIYRKDRAIHTLDRFKSLQKEGRIKIMSEGAKAFSDVYIQQNVIKDPDKKIMDYCKKTAENIRKLRDDIIGHNKTNPWPNKLIEDLDKLGESVLNYKGKERKGIENFQITLDRFYKEFNEQR